MHVHLIYVLVLWFIENKESYRKIIKEKESRSLSTFQQSKRPFQERINFIRQEEFI
jgi:hypothetical protein